jgi:hypothetical protein
MSDQHVIACAMIFQDVLLLINAGLIAWYLWETHKLRLAAEDQVTKSQSQISATYEQVEAMRQQVQTSTTPPSCVIAAYARFAKRAGPF